MDNKIIEILMKRDGMTLKEATSQVKYVRELVDNACGDYDEVEDIMSNELGLEMDYLHYILF